VTEPAQTDRSTRAATAAAIALACAVALGAVFLGAPPRFAAGTSGPAPLREFLVALGPLSIVEATIALAFGLLVASECLRRESPGLPGGGAAARTRLPLVLLMVLGLVQLVPLPAGVLEIVAPFSARTYTSLRAMGDESMRPISLWPAGTAHALFNLAGVIAASAAVWALVRGGNARRTAACVLAVVAVIASAEAAHGLCATKLGGDLLLGTFRKASDNGRVTGTFIHATMMAVWSGMGACAALGLAAAAASDSSRRKLAPFAVVATALCVGAGLFTLSRLGWIGIAAGVLTTWILLALTLRRGGRSGAATVMGVAALGLVAGAGAAMLAVPAFRERIDLLFTSTGVADPRFPMWRSTRDLFFEAPVLGTGLGSFGRAIHLTQSPDCAQELWFAHSDPLNLLSDAGVVGALLGAWWIVAMVRRGLPALRSDDVATRCLSAGAFGAAVVVLVASLGDFQTQFPVVAVAFAALFTIPAALAGAAAAAQPVDEPRPWLVPPKALAAGVLGVACVAAATPLAETIGRWRDVRDTGLTGATRAESLVAQGRSLLANVKRSTNLRADLARAESQIREAARRDPLLDDAHLWTAFAALALDQAKDDVLRALGRARLVARGRAHTNLEVGLTYLDMIGTSPAPFGPPGDGAIAALREAGDIEPKAFSVAWAACIEGGMSLDVLEAVTPDRGHAKATLFDHLRSIGRTSEAVRILRPQLAREPWDLALTTRLAVGFRETGRESEGRSFFDSVGAKWPATE
jgi:hypothetical protein